MLPVLGDTYNSTWYFVVNIPVFQSRTVSTCKNQSSRFSLLQIKRGKM